MGGVGEGGGRCPHVADFEGTALDLIQRPERGTNNSITYRFMVFRVFCRPSCCNCNCSCKCAPAAGFAADIQNRRQTCWLHIRVRVDTGGIDHQTALYVVCCSRQGARGTSATATATACQEPPRYATERHATPRRTRPRHATPRRTRRGDSSVARTVGKM